MVLAPADLVEMSILLSTISTTELLELYGYEPIISLDEEGSTIDGRWRQLTANWSPKQSAALGELRQLMLRTHLELCPDDERWR